MDKKESWLDKIHKNTKILFDIELDLQYKADCFYGTGNTFMCDELLKIAKSLSHARNEISNAVLESINENLRNAQQSTKNMIEACLAGITITKKENDRVE